jgi:hypothetical protein
MSIVLYFTDEQQRETFPASMYDTKANRTGSMGGHEEEHGRLFVLELPSCG